MKILFAVIAAAVCLTALLLIVASVCAFRFAIIRPKTPKLPTNDDEKNRQHIRNINNEYILSKHPVQKEINSFDGLKLKALLMTHDKSDKKFVVLVHGYQCNGRDEMSHLARHYYDDLGFACLIPDNRAHGKSEGNYIGFGYLDHFDILSWCNYLVKTFGDDIEIMLHGISMGAATVMMTAGSENAPVQIKGVIEDCGYNDMDEEIQCNVRDMTKMNLSAVKSGASLICKKKAGYFFKQASPREFLKSATVPVLFIHGTEDAFVPTYMGKELYEAYKGEKELLLVDGARHARSYYIAKEKYDSCMDSFIEKCLRKSYNTSAVTA